MISLWWIAYPFGVLMKSSVADGLSRLALWGGAIFVLVISPRLHGDTRASRGLGDPRWIWQTLRSGTRGRRLTFAAMISALILLLTTFLYQHAPAAARFFLGLPAEMVAEARHNAGGQMMIFGICLAVSSLWMILVMRYDNFLSALAVAGKMLALFLPATLGFALLCNGPGVFFAVNMEERGISAIGYVFWGAIQQLLFCGYFGTRLRKGFAPAADPAIRWRRRLLVAILNGSFFGLIHINSWALVAATWLLGTFLSWAFMEDRARNLTALGIVHGVLGTCIGCLFDGHQGFHVRMRVGPWWMPGLDGLTLAIASLVIMGLSLFLWIVLRRRLDDAPCGRAIEIPL